MVVDQHEPDEPPAVADEMAVALDTADPLYRPYLIGVKRRIWERWSTPVMPKNSAPKGVLLVEFTLARSGRLSSSGVRETSGFPALDRAALDAVVRAAPFVYD